MNDSQILDWLQTHACEIGRTLDGRYAITWFDNKGREKDVYGINLRDCVLGAVLEQQGTT